MRKERSRMIKDKNQQTYRDPSIVGYYAQLTALQPAEKTILTFTGSLLLPLNGSGLRYGESVSINIFSIGTYFTTSLRSEDFLKVIMPLNEMKHPRSNSFFANSKPPVKQ